MTLGWGQCHYSLQVTFHLLVSAKPEAKVVPAFWWNLKLSSWLLTAKLLLRGSPIRLVSPRLKACVWAEYFRMYASPSAILQTADLSFGLGSACLALGHVLQCQSCMYSSPLGLKTKELHCEPVWIFFWSPGLSLSRGRGGAKDNNQLLGWLLLVCSFGVDLAASERHSQKLGCPNLSWIIEA